MYYMWPECTIQHIWGRHSFLFRFSWTPASAEPSFITSSSAWLSISSLDSSHVVSVYTPGMILIVKINSSPVFSVHSQMFLAKVPSLRSFQSLQSGREYFHHPWFPEVVLFIFPPLGDSQWLTVGTWISLKLCWCNRQDKSLRNV